MVVSSGSEKIPGQYVANVLPLFHRAVSESMESHEYGFRCIEVARPVVTVHKTHIDVCIRFSTDA